MLKKVGIYTKKLHMLSAEDTVAVGVSGGADSVCLLLVLCELQKQIPFRLLVVHVNHKIREDAGQDAAFVENLCRERELPFFLVEKEVSAIATERGISTEEAGREVRYAAFEDTLFREAPEKVESGHAKIAVAHTADDRAETMLFHLFRGSGISGLGSIRPVRKSGHCTIIRPLLSTSRSEIESFLTERGMSWCTDSTNEEDDYTRNRIRHHILPYAKQEVCTGAATNMCRAADILCETEDFVERETEKAYINCMVRPKTVNAVFVCAVLTEPLLACHILLQKRVILRCIAEAAGQQRDITAGHVEDVLRLFEKEGNRQIHLPCGVSVRREYDKVFFEKGTLGETPDHGSFEVELPKPDGESVCVELSDGSQMEFSVFTCKNSINIPQNQYTKWFDYDKIKKLLKIRARACGDYITINDAFSKKTVQDYMVNEKIPSGERDGIWLLAEENHILWMVGYRISSFYKVTENTKKILQVQFRGGQEHVGACKGTFVGEGSR